MKSFTGLEVYRLFGVVEKKNSPLQVDFDNGVVYLEGSSWSRDIITPSLLSQNKLNKTFHKTWGKVKDSSREELFVHQLLHYLSTYGSDFEGDTYLPSEEFGTPENNKMTVIKSLTREDILFKAENMITSGIALGEDTLSDLICVLEYLGCDFKTLCVKSKNKEFNTQMILKGYYTPTNPEEVLRASVFAATGNTLLIKNSDLIAQIKESDFDPSHMFHDIGLHVMSQVFNRYKPMFLAFKNKCPSVVNKIAKHSKKCHRPIRQNPLNLVTTTTLESKDNKVLENSNIFSLFKAYNSVHMYLGGKKAVSYKIRNGKVWVEKKSVTRDDNILIHNLQVLQDVIKNRLHLEGKKVYIPEGISYTLPTSEKKMFGGIPYGSSVEGENLAVGIYWENSWGARDLDLSGVSLSSKVGWNSSYNSNGLLYSGDMTNAPSGAVEFLHCRTGTFEPTLIMNNVFNGEDNTKYRIIVGSGCDIDREYMMSKDNLVFYADTVSQSKSSYLGLMTASKGKCKFIITNMAVGNARVSGNDDKSEAARISMLEELNRLPTINSLIKDNIVTNKSEADIDLSPSNMNKDALISLFM